MTQKHETYENVLNNAREMTKFGYPMTTVINCSKCGTNTLHCLNGVGSYNYVQDVGYQILNYICDHCEKESSRVINPDWIEKIPNEILILKRFYAQMRNGTFDIEQARIELGSKYQFE